MNERLHRLGHRFGIAICKDMHFAGLGRAYGNLAGWLCVLAAVALPVVRRRRATSVTRA